MEMTEKQRQLAEENINLVHYEARKWRRTAQDRGVDYEDIVQEGTIGLCLAAMKFDPDRGFAFSTLAVPFIHGYINRYFRDNNLLKTSRQALDWCTAVTRYKLSHGEDYDEVKMFEELGIDPHEYELLMLSRAPVPLDGLVDPTGDSNSETTWQELIPDTDYDESIAYDLEESTLIDLETKIVSTMSPRNRDIIDEYFYSRLVGDKINQKELGKKYGLSQPQIQRIVGKFTDRLYEEYIKLR